MGVFFFFMYFVENSQNKSIIVKISMNIGETFGLTSFSRVCAMGQWFCCWCDDAASVRCPYLCIYSMKHLHEKSFSFLLISNDGHKNGIEPHIVRTHWLRIVISSSLISMSRRKPLRAHSVMLLILGFSCVISRSFCFLRWKDIKASVGFSYCARSHLACSWS